jgi:hypothetical protein
MNKIVSVVLLMLFVSLNAQINSGRPSDAEDISDEVAEMSDREFARYESKARKNKQKSEWIIFGILVVGGITYYYLRNKNKK